MNLVAGAGLGAGHGEQRDLLALEDIVSGLDLDAIRRHHAKLGLGQFVANFDRHCQFSSNDADVLAGKSAAVEKGLLLGRRDATENAVSMRKASEPADDVGMFLGISEVFRMVGGGERGGAAQRG